MAWEPPYKLDPHLAVRDPTQLPILLRRGMYDVIKKEDEGSLHDKFIRAFNFIAHALTESGRLRQGTLDLTPAGIKREKEVLRLKDTKTKLYWLNRWAEQLREKDRELYLKTWWQARKEGA